MPYLKEHTLSSDLSQNNISLREKQNNIPIHFIILYFTDYFKPNIKTLVFFVHFLQSNLANKDCFLIFKRIFSIKTATLRSSKQLKSFGCTGIAVLQLALLSSAERSRKGINMRRNERKNMRLLGVTAALGISAVALSLFAAYRNTTKGLVPTGSSGSDYVYTYSGSSSEVPANNSISNVPKSSSEKSNQSSQPAEEVNKPVAPEIGNIMPVDGEVSHPFSNGELVKSETLGVWKTHDGCDILCDLGTDVKSMSEGVVKMIDSSTVWGVCVTVEQTNGLEVRYCGLAKELNLKAGAMVKQGEIIGKTGDTNEAEMLQKPHLHLEVKRSGSWVDPVSVIG